ncbi:hypothetical protein H4R34_003115 [Dimargaris verticillata]|uniref:Carbonic anhydrase n=1 Tax=Dimargaris verticillata TaxID=2761393 RepID=A0A9W8B7I2_9FUNG|nr:hypothetical protein H4R34_003115 [Dimargaris verticillata]
MIRPISDDIVLGHLRLTVAALIVAVVLSGRSINADSFNEIIGSNTDDNEPLIQGNRQWVSQTTTPANLISQLAATQSPKYLWIGCSDSRVPPTTLTGMTIGDIFVARNITNVINPGDATMMSVIEYALLHLKGSIDPNLETKYVGPFLGGVKRLTINNPQHFPNPSLDSKATLSKLTQFNVVRSLRNLKNSEIYDQALKINPNLKVEAWVHDVATGLLNRFDDNHPNFQNANFS